jgi:dihydrofolate synthase/folylpolyglutamate synthase
VERARAAVAKVPKLTTFEITTALALLHFAEAQVDVAVVEVGLGGRLDATNVVLPLVATITSLSYDHMAVLGETLAQIAGEKAGIIKEGIPVISAPQKAEALQVLQRVAEERRAPFRLVGRDVTFTARQHSLESQSLQVSGPGGVLDLRIPLLGQHQVQNAATATAALWEMSARGLSLSNAAIQRGFAAAKWPARFEIAQIDPPVIFDSAHNGDSFARLRQTLDEYFPGKSVNLVFGASEDKNIPGMFDEMRGKVRHLLVTKADHPRALSVGKIAELAATAGLEAEELPQVSAAFERALELSAKDGSITLSAGSMFVTAEAIAAWRDRKARQSGAQP